MEIHITKNTNMMECFKTKSNWWWYYIANFDISELQLVQKLILCWKHIHLLYVKKNHFVYTFNFMYLKFIDEHKKTTLQNIMGSNVSNVMKPMTFKGKHFNLGAPIKHPFVVTTTKKQHYVFQLMKEKVQNLLDSLPKLKGSLWRIMLNQQVK